MFVTRLYYIVIMCLYCFSIVLVFSVNELNQQPSQQPQKTCGRRRGSGRSVDRRACVHYWYGTERTLSHRASLIDEI